MTTKKKTAPKVVAEKEVVITAYKGFNKNLTCSPDGKMFQYEIGNNYEHKGSVVACSSGFHACEFPLAVLSYYGLKNGNRFAIVEQSGALVRKDDKTASGKITIKAEIGIPGLIKASVEWVRMKASEPTSGDSAHSATSGNSAHSATSGDSAHSATSGNSAHSATSGDYANSATSGYSARVSSKGVSAIAANAGDGAAKASKDGAIFIVERDRNRNILAVFASMVGENDIKADTWYVLKGGKPVEVQE